MTEEMLPEDPAGWQIDLTDDRKWRPYRVGDEPLGEFDSKREAVDAILAADEDAPHTEMSATPQDR